MCDLALVFSTGTVSGVGCPGGRCWGAVTHFKKPTCAESEGPLNVHFHQRFYRNSNKHLKVGLVST